MYKTLIVGLILLGGCTVRNPGLPFVLTTANAPQDARLVPDNKHSVEVQMIWNEIKSFYFWLLETHQLLIESPYGMFPEEREVDPITHLPIPKPELSDLEMREKLGELLKEMPVEGDQGIRTKG